jgi:hypothetical protein
MDPTIPKKHREARYFYRLLVEETGGSLEHTEFLLSAFLAAGRTVETRAVRVYGNTFKSFRADWATRNPDDERVLKQMTDDRNMEVHERGATHVEADERMKIPVGFTYTDQSGTYGSHGPPDMPPTEIVRRALFFRVDGQDILVVDRCRHVVDILAAMMAEFADTLPS